MNKLLSASIILLLLSFSFNAFSQDKEKERAREKEREQELQRTESAVRAREAYVHSTVTPAKPAPPATVGTAYSYGDGLYYVNSSGSSSSQLSLSKTFDGESKKNEGTFEVDESIRMITLTLSGGVKEGEIKIEIVLPDGKKLKELTIDESADIQFNQTIKISEEENRYYGKWKYSVESVKAIGQYRLMIGTR